MNWHSQLPHRHKAIDCTVIIFQVKENVFLVIDLKRADLTFNLYRAKSHLQRLVDDRQKFTDAKFRSHGEAYHI